MRLNVMILTAAAIVLLAPRTRAQTVPPSQSVDIGAPAAAQYVDPVGGLSLEEAITLALKHEPSFRAARTEIDAALGRRQQAALRANPTATFERREEPAGTDNQTTLALQLPLELFRRGARTAVAEREIDVARHAVADRERRVAADVRARYGEVLVGIRELAVLDELLGAAKRQLELVTARVKEGATPPLEADLLDVEARRLVSDRRLQTGRVDAALVALKRAVAIPADAPLRVRETLEQLVARESDQAPAAASGTEVRQRPDVLAAEARIAAAEARVRQSASEGRFDLTVFGNYMRMDAGFMQMGFGPGGGLERVRGVFNYVTGGAMVIVPLLNRNQGAVATARAERAGAAAAHDAAVLDAEAEVAAGRIEDVSAREAVAQYREGAQRLARKNLDVVAQTFQLGRATVFDVLSEQRRYLEVERAFTDALRSAFEARTRLKLALGALR